MDRKAPQRKRLRLPEYDYAQPGYYFITVCTRERKQEVLCSIEPAVGAIINRPPRISLTPLGRIVNETIRAIPDHYPGILVDQFIIMPDHVHLIIPEHRTGRAADCRPYAAIENHPADEADRQQTSRSSSLAEGLLRPCDPQ